MGHLAKSDGRVSEREIAAARAVMSDFNLNAAQVRTAIECFTAGKDPLFDLDNDLALLRQACAGRPDLLHIFLEIQVRAAIAGNDLGGPVSALLARVASQLGISRVELAYIEAALRVRRGSFTREPTRDRAQQTGEAYRVLEIAATASDEEVVKAYRRQLSRHHPDKLKANGLPDSMIEHAKERTQQIIEAYELIRERRGL
jgi:DnaJ like chaperone protein